METAKCPGCGYYRPVDASVCPYCPKPPAAAPNAAAAGAPGLLIPCLVGAALLAVIVVSRRSPTAGTITEAAPSAFLSEASGLSRKADGAAEPAGGEPAAEVSRLISMLGSPSADDRLQAVQRLTDIRYAANAEAAVAPLQKALDDPEPQVRKLAKKALDRIAAAQRRGGQK